PRARARTSLESVQRTRGQLCPSEYRPRQHPTPLPPAAPTRTKLPDETSLAMPAVEAVPALPVRPSGFRPKQHLAAFPPTAPTPTAVARRGIACDAGRRGRAGFAGAAVWV